MPSTTPDHSATTDPASSGRGRRLGLLSGTGAYVLWGATPGFWALVDQAAPVEILAHRLAWTLVLMVVVCLFLGRLSALRGLGPRRWALISVAAILIAVNWGVYIYAVLAERVIEVSLGYYINPLISVLLGVLVLGERLRGVQWIALGVAATAVLVVTLDYGRLPVIALVVAGSFAVYGLLKKTVPLDSLNSLTAESMVLAPFAMAYLVWLQVTGAATFLAEGPLHSALLIAAGPVTALPLLLFGFAAQRIPLSVMGMLQYLAPTLQLLWAVLIAGESMPASRWIGFGLVWLALAIFSIDALRTARRAGAAAAAARRQTESTVSAPDQL
ncbi:MULTISPECIES: EamA family transporter RarD [Actinoalloteichus]|uniref:RarD protein n=1 Tax=Actinoalloteichus fjordicus TaxID=1612552 RepID=A0AAC9LA63_9PSEU|nr:MULTISPECIES: EamA family transporter RarD [Actinoalloteichus]APU12614.1 rarD protein [Actinoalloteichus fjordicus]APU18567.1 rarD protein [Actinoalloteichus sp. GBA129-24]